MKNYKVLFILLTLGLFSYQPYLLADNGLPKLDQRKKPQKATKKVKTSKKQPIKRVGSGELSLPTTSVQMYEAVKTANFKSKVVAQEFVATGHQITRFEFDVRSVSHYETVTFVLYDSRSNIVFNKQQSARWNQNLVIDLTDNPVSVKKGDRYRVKIKAENELRIGSSRFKKGYPFGSMSCSVCKGRSDLAGSIMGVKMTHQVSRPRVTKTALLVLIENGGYSMGFPTEIDPIKVSVPTGYVKCGNHRIKVTSPSNMIKEVSSWIVRFIKNGGSTGDRCLKISAIKNRWITEKRKVNVGQTLQNKSDYFLEEAGKGLINSLARGKYDRILFLEDNQFTTANIINRLKMLQNTYQVDIHILAHGSKYGFTGGDSSRGLAETMDERRFFIPMKQAMERGEVWAKIRSVYQQNCFGSYHNKAWKMLNAGVVSGTRELNSMPFTYGTFLRHWVNGKNFTRAVIDGYNEVKPFYQYSYGLVRPSNTAEILNDSLPVILGNGSYRIQ